MAHVAHFKASDLKRIVNEYDRDEKYKCRDGRIDSSKTNLNYKMESDDFEIRFGKRFSEVEHSNRKDLNVISTWVITCPQELQNDSDRVKFFKLSYEFVQARYGADNVIQGYVHNDETTPHMHIPVIPVKDKRVSAKALFTRSELHSFHKDLDKVMEDEFGIKGLILNGRTKGNYTVSELKERTKQEQALSEREENANIEDYALSQRQEALDSRETRLNAREDDLTKREKDFALTKLKWRNKANNELEELKKQLNATAKAEFEKQQKQLQDYYNSQVEKINKWASDYKNQLEQEYQEKEDAREAQFKIRVEKAAERRFEAAQREQEQEQFRKNRQGFDISDIHW